MTCAPTGGQLSHPPDEDFTWYLLQHSQHSEVIHLPVHILSALSLSRCNGFDLVTCSGIVSQTRLGVAVPHSPAMCQRQQNSPGFSKLWAFSETGEDWTQTLPEPLSRPVPRLLDKWSCHCNDINAKSPPNKSKLHSVWSTACEVFLSSPLSLQTSLPRL